MKTTQELSTHIAGLLDQIRGLADRETIELLDACEGDAVQPMAAMLSEAMALLTDWLPAAARCVRKARAQEMDSKDVRDRYFTFRTSYADARRMESAARLHGNSLLSWIGITLQGAAGSALAEEEKRRKEQARAEERRRCRIITFPGAQERTQLLGHVQSAEVT